MVNPVPGYGISTPYGKQGSHWTTCGYHTGCDYSAPSGTSIVAARSGTVSHVNYGSAFGNHQWVVRPGDGTEDFYAHASSRPSNGSNVTAGQAIGKVGSEGNSTGPHLHFERHKGYGWSCGLCVDPSASIDAEGGSTGAYPTPTSGKVYLSKLHTGQSDSDSVWYLQQQLNAHPLDGGETLPLTAYFGADTSDEVVRCQQQHGYGNDPVTAAFVGPGQAEHLFGGSGLTVINDL